LWYRGIEPFLIGSALNIAIAQRLVRRICPYCKEEVEVTDEVIREVKEELMKVTPDQRADVDLDGPLKFYKGSGCKECKNTGSSGRVGIYEILSMTPEMEKIIHSSVTDSDIEAEAHRQGMVTIKQDGIMKALMGLTTVEEILRATEE